MHVFSLEGDVLLIFSDKSVSLSLIPLVAFSLSLSFRQLGERDLVGERERRYAREEP